jgi:hypothetical protein
MRLHCDTWNLYLDFHDSSYLLLLCIPPLWILVAAPLPKGKVNAFDADKSARKVTENNFMFVNIYKFRLE